MILTSTIVIIVIYRKQSNWNNKFMAIIIINYLLDECLVNNAYSPILLLISIAIIPVIIIDSGARLVVRIIFFLNELQFSMI